MSKYTTELRYICEMEANLSESKGYDDVDEIITLAAPKIFNNFPIFDEAYRLPLEKKILMHYYTREISEEVVGLWKLRLAARMNEIMPYFNKLYDSELLKFNPLYDVDYRTQRENSGTSVGTNKGKTESEGNKANTAINSLQSNKDTDSTNEVEGTKANTELNSAKEVNDKGVTTEGEKSTTDSVIEDSKNVKDNLVNIIDEVTGTESTTNRGTEGTTSSTANGKTSATSTSTNGGESFEQHDVKSVTEEDTDKTTLASDTHVATDDDTHRLDNETHWDMYSDTPQTTIRDIGTGSDHNYYLTNARENTDEIDETVSKDTLTDTHFESEENVKKDITIDTDENVVSTKTNAENTNVLLDEKGNIVSNENVVSDYEKNIETSQQTGRTEDTSETITGNISKSGNENVVNTGSEITKETKENTGSKTANESTINTEKSNAKENSEIASSNITNGFTNDRTESDFTNTLNTTDEFTERVFGKRGSVTYSKMLMELRDSFINIDQLIIRELGDLFFGLW